MTAELLFIGGRHELRNCLAALESLNWKVQSTGDEELVMFIRRLLTPDEKAQAQRRALRAVFRIVEERNYYEVQLALGKYFDAYGKVGAWMEKEANELRQLAKKAK